MSFAQDHREACFQEVEGGGEERAEDILGMD